MNTTQPLESSDTLAYNRLFDILSSLYLHRPTEEMVEAFNAIATEEGFGVDVEIPPVHETISELITDYDELFLVPVSGRYLPPFESAQRAQRLWGPLTHQIVDFYRIADFNPGILNIDDVWKNLNMPDHIGIEMAFNSSLLQVYTNDPIPEIAELIRTLTHQHLSLWMPEFGEKLCQNAKTSLYYSLGTLTTTLVKYFTEELQ